jgi:hypothetical protein
MRPLSGTFGQQVAGATEYSIWGSTTVGTENVDPLEPNIVIGTKFKTNTNGNIIACRWQRISGQAQATSFALYQGSTNISGTNTISGGTDSGWQRQNFSSAQSVTSGTIYMICLLHPGLPTAYYVTGAFFASAYTNGPLTAVATSESSNGLYEYSPTMVAPTNNFNNTCYYIDVVFTS